ncbi:hypothetical protein MXD63_01185 [Frankia sp. Cpl3]|nr:hypothetical protein [Parafrankia colletiae]MCK9898696.1 hypothetical protein [Frankia sp. Cpl3]
MSGLAAQDPRVAIVGPRFDSEPDALTVSRDHPELTRFVNGVLERALADGTWRGLARNWLTGIDPVIPVPRYRD